MDRFDEIKSSVEAGTGDSELASASEAEETMERLNELMRCVEQPFSSACYKQC